MSIFRRTRLSDDQLREILQSLPQVTAPADFEDQLDRMIALHAEHVPHVLGAMPMVPAADDFDARLMEAIGDASRPVAPIPAAILAGGASANWLNHILGLIGGSLAVVAVAFFISSDADRTETPAFSAPTGIAAQVMHAPVSTPHRQAAGGSVGSSGGAVHQPVIADAGTASAATATTNDEVTGRPLMAEHSEHTVSVAVAPAAPVRFSADHHGVTSSSNATVATSPAIGPQLPPTHTVKIDSTTAPAAAVDSQHAIDVTAGGATTIVNGDHGSASPEEQIDTGGRGTRADTPKNK